MPTTDDIRQAIARGAVDEAELLIRQVSAKRNGKGLSGHDQQDFATQIRRIRTLRSVAIEAEPEAPAPVVKPKARTKKR